MAGKASDFRNRKSPLKAILKSWICKTIYINGYNLSAMKKSISADLTPANIAQVMEVLTESPTRLEIGRAHV